MLNMFKFNNKETKTTSVSHNGVFTINFHTFS